jgi:Ion channel
MLLAILLATLLVVATFLFHYKVLLLLAAFVPRLNIAAQAHVLIIVFALFLTHVAEIGFYAMVYAWAIHDLGLGSLKGLATHDPMEFLYFSIVTFTSLGLGDVYPDGHIRFLAGVETLNGLLLIAWSGSFTFLAMGRQWPWGQCG